MVLNTELQKFNLTQRETQILKLIMQNYSNKQIASTLNIHIDTVKSHVSNILYKTNTQDRFDLFHKFFKDEINQLIKNIK